MKPPYYVSGGWLLEVNGNDTRVYGMAQNNDVSKGWFNFTSHSPEKVSQVQVDYISRLISKVDSCVFVNNKNDTLSHSVAACLFIRTGVWPRN